MIVKLFFVSTFSLGLTLMPAFSQRGGKGNGSPLPLQGKPLPEVIAYDESGAEFPLLQKTQGRYTVIVFGCLT